MTPTYPLSEDDADVPVEYDAADLTDGDAADTLTEDAADVSAENDADAPAEDNAETIAGEDADVSAEDVNDVSAEDDTDIPAEDVTDVPAEDDSYALVEDDSNMSVEDNDETSAKTDGNVASDTNVKPTEDKSVNKAILEAVTAKSDTLNTANREKEIVEFEDLGENNKLFTTDSAAPVIIVHPVDVTADEGSTATFKVTATGDNLSYQWQYRWGNSGTWTNTSSTGNKTATLTVNAPASWNGIPASWNGIQYRCVVTNSGGTAESNAATLTVTTDKFTVDNIVYQIIDMSNARVYAYNGSNTSLTIPQAVNGYTIIEVGTKAFENHTELQSIDLPDSIQVIATRAFAGCTALSTMS